MYISYKYPSEAIKGYNTKISKSENRDCVVRAIATAFEITYNQAHKFCEKEYGRSHKNGVNAIKLYSVNKKISKENIEIFGKNMTEIGDECKWTGMVKPFTYYKKKDWKGKTYKKQCKMTVGTFVKKYPKGTFILSVRGHLFTIKGGTVIGGNREDSRKKRVIVEKAWEIS